MGALLRRTHMYKLGMTMVLPTYRRLPRVLALTRKFSTMGPLIDVRLPAMLTAMHLYKLAMMLVLLL